MEESKKIHRLPLVSSPDPNGPWIAQAMAQMNVRVNGIWIDGKIRDLEPRTYTVGELIREPLGFQASAQSTVAFRVETIPYHAPDPVEGMIEGSGFIAQRYMGEVTRTLLSATVVKPNKPSKIVLQPDATYILSVQLQINCRIIGLEFLVEALCGTCRGTDQVGYPGHSIVCPVCKGDPAFVMKPLVGKIPSHRVLLNDLKMGMRSQFLSGSGLPLEAFNGMILSTDICCIGQFIIFDLTNNLDAPVRISGQVVCEEIEFKEMTKEKASTEVATSQNE
jgi:hypothetical protein